MTPQDIPTATFDAPTKAQFHKKLVDIKHNLRLLLTLNTKEIKVLFQADQEFSQFFDKTLAVAQQHPNILPEFFDQDKFKQDHQLFKELSAVVSQLSQNTATLQSNLSLVRGDTLAGALEIYTAVKAHRHHVPGLNAVADELARFFKKVRSKSAMREAFNKPSK